jgi:hypothetical protein
MAAVGEGGIRHDEPEVFWGLDEQDLQFDRSKNMFLSVQKDSIS